MSPAKAECKTTGCHNRPLWFFDVCLKCLNKMADEDAVLGADPEGPEPETLYKESFSIVFDRDRIRKIWDVYDHEKITADQVYLKYRHFEVREVRTVFSGDGKRMGFVLITDRLPFPLVPLDPSRPLDR